MSKHKPVPVSKDLLSRDPDEVTRWRCAGCGKEGVWPGSIAFDGECPQEVLPLFEDAS